MNTRDNKTSSYTELVHIGLIGFEFEVKPNLKYNLINPDVLLFFDGVPESYEVTMDCAFPLFKPYTNLRYSIFKNLGYDWVVCSDGVFRKCQKVKCSVELNSIPNTFVFHIDRSLADKNIMGIISI